MARPNDGLSSPFKPPSAAKRQQSSQLLSNHQFQARPDLADRTPLDIDQPQRQGDFPNRVLGDVVGSLHAFFGHDTQIAALGLTVVRRLFKWVCSALVESVNRWTMPVAAVKADANSTPGGKDGATSAW